MDADIWPWVVTLLTLAGIAIAGCKDRRGWLLCLAAKVVLAGYALATDQPGFIAEGAALGAIYLRNWHRWGNHTPAP